MRSQTPKRGVHTLGCGALRGPHLARLGAHFFSCSGFDSFPEWPADDDLSAFFCDAGTCFSKRSGVGCVRAERRDGGDLSAGIGLKGCPAADCDTRCTLTCLAASICTSFTRDTYAASGDYGGLAAACRCSISGRCKDTAVGVDGADTAEDVDGAPFPGTGRTGCATGKGTGARLVTNAATGFVLNGTGASRRITGGSAAAGAVTVKLRVLAMFVIRDVATVLTRHGMFFAADLMVLGVKRGCLSLADLATFHFVVDTPVLVAQTPIDFGTARVGELPRRFSHCANGKGSDAESDQRERNVLRLNIGSLVRLHETERSHALTTPIKNGPLTCEKSTFRKVRIAESRARGISPPRLHC